MGTSSMTERVALLTNFIPPYRLPLYKALAALVDDLQVFISTPTESNRPWIPEWEGLNVTVQDNITLRPTWRHPHGFSESLHVHVPYNTLSLLKRYQPDVVISVELGLRTLQAVLYRKWNPKNRIIVWALYSESTEQGRGRLREWLRRWLLPQIDAVVVNGESGARYIRSFGIPSEKIFFAPYTTQISTFDCVSLPRTPSQVYRLLYVGQLVERKGVVPFLSTLSRWAEAHPERSLEFWLVGDGPLRTNLEQLVLPPNISLRFLGNVAYKDLSQIYAQAGILVFPTLADEWGLVVNEAMATGLPVLGSIYSQAVEELVVDGVTGWTFHPDQVDEMYMALDRALSTPIEELDRMRATERDRIQHLTPEFVAERLLQAIRYVC